MSTLYLIGPLPRDFVYRKTPPGTPIHVPSYPPIDTGLIESTTLIQNATDASGHMLQHGLNTPVFLQLTPPASPMNYQQTSGIGILTENKFAVNGK